MFQESSAGSEPPVGETGSKEVGKKSWGGSGVQ